MFLDVYARYGAEWAPQIVAALWTTFALSSLGFAFALLLGLALALGRLGASRPLRAFCTAYVELFRGVPTLVVLFLVYFALPEFGLVLDAFWAGVAGLAIGTAGYAAEIVRAGLQSIHFGQREAALSVGLTPAQAMRYILVPQALRVVLAPLCNLLVVLVKDSSLCALITAPELTLTGKDLASSTFLPMQIYLLIGLAYLALTLPLDALGRLVEKRLRR